MFAPSGYESERNERAKGENEHFSSEILSGVMIAAAFTYVFAIPANSCHWKTEIWKRGGGVWTFVKNGHSAWKWLVQPVTNTPLKRVVAPPSAVTRHRAVVN